MGYDRKKVAKNITEQIKNNLERFYNGSPEGPDQLDIVHDTLMNELPHENEVIYHSVVIIKCLNTACRVVTFRALPMVPFNMCPSCHVRGVANTGQTL